MDDLKPEERRQTSLTLPSDVLLALQNAANAAGITQSELALQALMQDARVAFELDLRRRAMEAQR